MSGADLPAAREMISRAAGGAVTLEALAAQAKSDLDWIAAHQKSAAKARREAWRRRQALGRLLLDVRRHYPLSGPRAAGWGHFLKAIRLHERTARRYMYAADPKISDTDSKVSEISARLWPADRWLPRLNDVVTAFTARVAPSERRVLALHLRTLAEQVEAAPLKLVPAARSPYRVLRGASPSSDGLSKPGMDLRHEVLVGAGSTGTKGGSGGAANNTGATANTGRTANCARRNSSTADRATASALGHTDTAGGDAAEDVTHRAAGGGRAS